RGRIGEICPVDGHRRPGRQGVTYQGYRELQRQIELGGARELGADQAAQRQVPPKGLSQLIDGGGIRELQRGGRVDSPRAIHHLQGDGAQVGRGIGLAYRADNARLERRGLNEEVLLKGIAGQGLPRDRPGAQNVDSRDPQVRRRVGAVGGVDGEALRRAAAPYRGRHLVDVQRLLAGRVDGDRDLVTRSVLDVVDDVLDGLGPLQADRVGAAVGERDLEVGRAAV